MAVTDIIKALQKHDDEVCAHAIDKFVEHISGVLMENDRDLLESLEEYMKTSSEAVKEKLKEESKQMVKNVKGKKVKDPNAPKRPPSAYNLFVKDKMEELSKKRPEVNRQELMRMAVEEWRATKPEEKKKKSPTKLLSDTEHEEDEEKVAPPPKSDDKKKSKKKAEK